MKPNLHLISFLRIDVRVTVLRSFALAFLSEGWRVQTIEMDSATNRYRRFIDRGIERLQLPFGRPHMPILMRLLRRVMRYVYFALGALILRARFKSGDITVVCDEWSFFLASLAIPFRGIVYYELEMPGRHSLKSAPLFERWLRGYLHRNVRKCALLISVEEHRRFLLSKYYQQPETATILNVPHRDDVINPSTKRYAADKPRVLYAGRLMNHTLAPILFEFIREYHTQYQIEIFGSPEKDCIAQFEQIKGLENVKFHGFVHREELKKGFQRADISIVMWDPLDTRNYGLKYCAPGKFFDAVAAQIPVVCSPNPSLMNWLSEFKVGEFVRPLTAESLNEAIVYVTSPENFEEYRKECRRSSAKWIYEEQARPVIERLKQMPQFRLPP